MKKMLSLVVALLAVGASAQTASPAVRFRAMGLALAKRKHTVAYYEILKVGSDGRLPQTMSSSPLAEDGLKGGKPALLDLNPKHYKEIRAGEQSGYLTTFPWANPMVSYSVEFMPDSDLPKVWRLFRKFGRNWIATGLYKFTYVR